MNLSRPKRGKLASTARFFCKKSNMPIDPKNIIIRAGKRKNSEKYIVAIKKTKLNNQTYNNTEKRPQISPISIFPSPGKHAPIFYFVCNCGQIKHRDDLPIGRCNIIS